MATSRLAVEVFCSYVSKDTEYLQQLEAHASALKRQGLISLWHNRQILPSDDLTHTIDEHLETASIILLLISADFLASDEQYRLEMQRALERQNANEARVIPIIVRPCDWQSLAFAALQPLPSDGRAISISTSIDETWTQVVSGLRHVIEDLPRLSASAPRFALPPTWMIPYPRNPFFLGREGLLSQIHAQLNTGQPIALSQPQAISGLGGIGKTQLAVEYAYRHAQEYQVVLWAQAESLDTLNASYSQIATILNLPEREAQEQTQLIQAVKAWLQTHRSWLLILDNADDLALLSAFLPPVLGGHLLITTRASAAGRLALPIKVETFTEEQGALFLLRRASLLAPDAPLSQATEPDQALASALTHELGGLPLALDQAGAYLEQTGIGLKEYQLIYQKHRPHLLGKRGGLVADHPESVATTWSLSFAQVERKDPVAADILRLSAFLAADAIPLAIMRGGTKPVAADSMVLSQALETLRAYSLVNYDAATQTLALHRLVQVVVREGVPKKKQKAWMQRGVTSVAATFPDPRDVSQWSACEQWLPHALICTIWIEQEQLNSAESARLLNEAGYYLDDRARYREAEPLYKRALAIYEQQLGGEHPSTATSLNNLAGLYQTQGKYAEAEPLYKRALAIREQQLGGEHPDTATSLNNLAALYDTQGKYAEAEPLYKRALAIREQQLGGEHPDTANSLNNLALLYKTQGKYAEAEPLYKRALAIYGQVLGREHPNTQTVRKNYVYLLQTMGHDEQARKLEEST